MADSSRRLPGAGNIVIRGRGRAWVLSPLAAAVAAILHGEALAEGAPAIEEIVVTATKRESNLQDLGQSISAFTGDDIQRMGLKDMNDYLKATPSVTLSNLQPGRNSIVIRGISTGSDEYRTDSSAAVYLDEQPMTTNSQQVDPWQVDIERIEVLPGPQGTLHGSSSQTGALRIITNKPNHEGISGQIDAGMASTRFGEPSYDLSGHINVPVADNRLALRAVAFYSTEGGYIDNVEGPDLVGQFDNSDIAEDDFNDYKVYGGRVAALWDVSDRWSVLGSVITQYSDTEGSWTSDPHLGKFKITKFLDEFREDDWYQVAATITGDLGFAEFSATTASFDRDIAYQWDNTLYEQYNAYAQPGTLYDRRYMIGRIFNDQQQERFSQEVRLTSTTASRLQWMIGGFYEDVFDKWLYGTKVDGFTDTPAWEAANQYAYAYYASYDNIQYPLSPTDVTYSNEFRRKVKQLAFFGEVTYSLTDDWDVTAGTRWFEYDRDEYDRDQWPEGLPPLDNIADDGAYSAGGKESNIALKFGTQYHIDSERMVYFIFSQGFRLGGYNSRRAAATGKVPLRYDSDTLNNFEVGLKSTWFDRRMQFNLSAFYMEWQDIQIDNAGGVDDIWWLRGNTNGDTAATRGVELYWAAHFTDSFKLEGSLFAADPQFTSDFTTINGDEITDGTVMPISPKFKIWLAAEYTFYEFMGRGDLWIRLDFSHQGKVYDSLYSAILEEPDGIIPSWSYSNLQAGIEFYNNWNMTLSIWNLFDQRVVNWIDDGYNDQAAALGDPRFRNLLTYEKPRTVGIGITKWFGQ